MGLLRAFASTWFWDFWGWVFHFSGLDELKRNSLTPNLTLNPDAHFTALDAHFTADVGLGSSSCAVPDTSKSLRIKRILPLSYLLTEVAMALKALVEGGQLLFSLELA